LADASAAASAVRLPCLHQDFYEDIFEEMDKYGEIENLNVCDNLADHMVGNVYVKFRDEDAAARALQVAAVHVSLLSSP
jgi:Flp pilus assembly CpaF family ATPase